VTRHLSPETFVDLLDSSRADSDVSHLASCAACRQQLEHLRETWRAANEADVPEPSPLFWEHLSARVRDAVAAEPARRNPWRPGGWQWGVAGLAGAAALVLALTMLPPLVDPANVAPQPTRATAALAPGDGTLAPEGAAADDEPLGFVAALAGTVDFDAVADLGFATRVGADRVVEELDAEERAELQRLLNEALGGGV
jgi:hypothetical protein